MGKARARAGLLALFLLVIGFGAGYAFRAASDAWLRRGWAPGGRIGGEETNLVGDPPPPHGEGRPPAAGQGPRSRSADGPEGPRTRLAFGQKGTEGSGEDEEGRRDHLRENPYRGLPSEEIEEALFRAADDGDPHRFKLAAEALGALSSSQIEGIALRLLGADRPEAVELFARQLVRFGGEEGLAVVSGVARSPELGIKMRAIAIEAIADAPPELRAAGSQALADLLDSSLPRKLEFHAAHAYGRTLGDGAVEGLAGLLDRAGARREPILHALRDFARREDLPRLTELLLESSAREDQEILLRAVGSAAGSEGGDLLLDLLATPPPNVRREAIGSALEEFAGREDLPVLWERLQAEDDRAVEAALARAIARVGGAEEVARLAEIASDPSAGISLDAVARALAGTASAETVPLMVGLLDRVRHWDAAEPLAAEILRLGGREGIETVLDLAGGGTSADRRRAIVQAVEQFGDPAAVDRLTAMLQVETDHGVAFHLAKAILRLDPAQGPASLASRIGEFESGDQRAAIADVLEREGDATLIPTLRQALAEEKNGRAQWHLTRTLTSFGEEGLTAVRELVERDSDPHRRAEVLRAVETVKPDAALSLARSLLADPSVEVRHSAIDVLAAHGGEARREELLRALAGEQDPKVRGRIAELLAQ